MNDYAKAAGKGAVGGLAKWLVATVLTLAVGGGTVAGIAASNDDDDDDRPTTSQMEEDD